MSDVLNMSVGQTEIHPAILATLLRPIESPAYFAEYKAMYGETVAMLQRILQTKQAPVVMKGTGRTGLEAGLYPLLNKGGRVLTIENGHWGQFLGDLAQNFGGQVERVSSGLGRAVDWSEVEDRLKRGAYAIVTMAHCETNTGALYDLAKARAVIDRVAPSALLVVDGISAFGGTPVDFDGWGVDCYIGGSQKCLNAPQGSPVVCLSERARKTAERLRPSKTYFHTLDLTHKPSYLLVRGLHALFDAMIGEGLSSLYARHTASASAARAGLLGLGLRPFVEDPTLYSPTVTRIVLPEPLQQRVDDERVSKGIDQDCLTQIMKNKYKVVIGESRIGTMGHYARSEYVVRTIDALGRTVKDLGLTPDIEGACKKAAAAYDRALGTAG